MSKGIKNVKELMVLGLQLGVAGKMAAEDKKLTVADLGLAVSVFPYVVPAFDDIGEVPSELADLDAAESEELLLEAAKQLPMITDKVTLMNIVVKAVKVALALGELASAIIKHDQVAKAPTEAPEPTEPAPSEPAEGSAE